MSIVPGVIQPFMRKPKVVPISKSDDIVENRFILVLLKEWNVVIKRYIVILVAQLRYPFVKLFILLFS